MALTDADYTTHKLSETFLKGPAGEEKADYSLSYKPDGTTIRSETVFWYDDGAGGVERATLADSEAPLRQQDTIRY